MSVSRRQFLQNISAISASIYLAPKAVAQSTPGRPLRVLGTGVTLQDDIRRRAEKELRIPIRFEPCGSASVLQKASTRPESFDVYEQWSNSINVLWQANAIQPIDITHIHAVLLTQPTAVLEALRQARDIALFRVVCSVL